MVTTNNLVSYWKMDETTGTTAVDIHGNNDLTANNARIFTTEAGGIINTSADFSGGIDHLKLTSGLETTTTFSISIWLKSTTEGNQYIIDHRGNIDSDGYLQVREDGTQFQFVDGANTQHNIDAASDVLNGTWNHVVLAISGTSLNYYLNGNKIGSTITISATSFDTNEVTTFGGIRPNGGNGTLDYNGQMDEIGIWDRQLSASDASDLWNSGNGLAYPFAVGTNISINIADTFKDVDSLQINIGDVWKDVVEIQQNIGDVWKTVF